MVASEKQHSCSLETDLSHAEEVAMELQSQLTSTQQELQEARELCGQHESLVEERNTELSSLETQIRCVCVCGCWRVWCVRGVRVCVWWRVWHAGGVCVLEDVVNEGVRINLFPCRHHISYYSPIHINAQSFGC